MRMKSLLLASVFCFQVAMPSFAQEVSDERIKALVAEALRENPELILEALQALEERQAEAQAAAATAVLANERDTLERDPNAPVLGNPKGDITVVEFFDYNCPYCKRAMPEVDALLAEDGNIRLVMREWPILSEGSAFAARAALASRKQGKYAELHNALMGMRGKVEADTVLRVAGEIGLDLDRLKADMQAPEIDEHIATSMRLAEALGFNGTPSFVVGDQLVPGFVERRSFPKSWLLFGHQNEWFETSRFGMLLLHRLPCSQDDPGRPGPRGGTMDRSVWNCGSAFVHCSNSHRQ